MTKVCELLLNHLFHFVEFLWAVADFFKQNFAIGPNDVVAGNAGIGELAVDAACLVGGHGIGVMLLVAERRDFGGRLFAGNTDEHEAFRFVFLPEFLFEARHFGPAGSAPGGPEIDEDDLALEIGGGDFLAGGIGEGEGGKLLADLYEGFEVWAARILDRGVEPMRAGQ